ncbi:hypothetical protein PI125_g25554 [Phytophthora idaei]|nr:hypothetical protein PI125_g25554 [Phytophthora idaei]
MVGVPNDEVRFKPMFVVAKGIKWVGSLIGSIQDIKDKLMLASRKKMGDCEEIRFGAAAALLTEHEHLRRVLTHGSMNAARRVTKPCWACNRPAPDTSSVNYCSAIRVRRMNTDIVACIGLLSWYRPSLLFPMFLQRSGHSTQTL